MKEIVLNCYFDISVGVLYDFVQFSQLNRIAHKNAYLLSDPVKIFSEWI